MKRREFLTIPASTLGGVLIYALSGEPIRLQAQDGRDVYKRQDIEILHGAERIAVHAQAVRRHQIVTQHEHHEGIPAVNRQSGKTLIHIQQSAPEVERRPLAAYEDLIEGGSR